MGVPANVKSLLRQLMRYWKTRHETWTKGEKKVSWCIDVMCGFLQEDSYSQVGFFLPEVPVCKSLQETKAYRMGQPRKREVKRTHNLFIDDLKVYQESHKILEDVNENIAQTSHDTGECYGVAKCAEIIF